MTRLRKLDSIVVNKIVIGLHTFQFGKVICIAFSDGSVEYRDRHSMNEVYDEASLDRVMTLNQVGFTLAEDTPCKTWLCKLFEVSAKLTEMLQVCRSPSRQRIAPSRGYAMMAKSSGTLCGIL